MYVKLKEDVALRSWRKVPRAYYRRYQLFAQALSPADWSFLRRADGETPIEESLENLSLLSGLQERGLCERCEPGSGGLSPWQRYRHCDNTHVPRAILVITGKCNFNCRHCFNAVDNAAWQAEMSFEQCQKLFAEMADCGLHSVMFTGGEPLLHPRFDDILRELGKHDLFLETILTNGSLLTGEKLSLIRGQGFRTRFEISYDGVGHHDWLRDKAGAEADVQRACRLVVEQGFPLKIQANVHKGNTASMLPTAFLAARLGAQELRVMRTSESPRWLLTSHGQSLSLDEYFQFVLDFIEGCIREREKFGAMTVDLWHVVQLMPVEKRYALVFGSREEDWAVMPLCKGIRGRVTITSEGEAVPCPPAIGYLKEHGISLGNVFTNTLREVINGDVGTYHGLVSTRNAAREGCQTCPWNQQCSGGCPLLGAGLGGGDFTGCDPMQRGLFGGGWADRIHALFARNGWRCG